MTPSGHYCYCIHGVFIVPLTVRASPLLCTEDMISPLQCISTKHYYRDSLISGCVYIGVNFIVYIRRAQKPIGVLTHTRSKKYNIVNVFFY